MSDRSITYHEAISEVTFQEMERDPSVFVYGIGVPDHNQIFNSLTGILDKFGPERCFDTPLSEDAMTGFGLGAAINGLRPIHIHIRVDFLILALNQLFNMVSSMQYVSGGTLKVPMVIRAVVGRGWGQGCQHSKSLQSIFAHVPGLKVIMPTSPYDVKGMLATAIRSDDPVVCLEHRWLYWQTGHVPEESYEVPFGNARIVRKGKDLTIVATSWMVVEAAHAAKILYDRCGVDIEVIDPRSIVPLDIETIANSVGNTGKCIVVDNDWTYCGVSAEIASQIYERCFDSLKAPIARMGFEPVPCPTARHLENEFYVNSANIIRSAEKMLDLDPVDLSGIDFYSHENRFKGPF